MIRAKTIVTRRLTLLHCKPSLLLLLSLFFVYVVPSVSYGEAAQVVAGVNSENQSKEQLKEHYSLAMQHWRYVLTTYVDEQGRTNFHALAKDIAPLEYVVSVIEVVSPSTTPQLFPSKEDVLAFYINTYNALAMYGVIERGIPDGFTNFFSRASFFKLRDVVIGGEVTNLYDFENDVIRPFDEPRVHFALNCMVKDCPRLPQEPFYAHNLDSELELLTTAFFANPKHFYLDSKRKRAYVSEILDFYTEDFVDSGKSRDLPQYINQYLASEIPRNYKVRFIEYDWRINNYH
jgi:hypothetical protein